MLASAAIHPETISSYVYSCARSKRELEERRTGDFLEDFLGDFGGDLVLGDSIWVRHGVVCNEG